jgi:hypothetical protein
VLKTIRRIIRCAAPSIPPEKLLRALLLQAFYAVCSERQLGSNLHEVTTSSGRPTQRLLGKLFFQLVNAVP